MKTCKKCGSLLEENATFCGKCGEKVSAETSIENVPKKHGYFWNITHYGILEKPVKSKVLKQTLIGGAILILLIILIPVIVAIAPKSSDKEKPESNTSGVISETESNSNTELNIKDSLVLDWDSTYKEQPRMFLGMVDNTLYFVLEDELYGSCLCSYNFDTKESKEIAKYYNLECDYNLTDDYLVFFAASDERGQQMRLMAYNIKSQTTTTAPTFYLDSSSDGRREMDLSEQKIDLGIIIDNKLYFQIDDYYIVYSFDLQKNIFEVIADRTVNNSMELDYKSSVPERITFDDFDKTCFYYTSNLHYTVMNEGATYPDYYDEFNLYKYDIASGTAQKIVSLKMDESEWVYGVSVVNGNIFLQYTSGDIYQFKDNTETKVFDGASCIMTMEDRLSVEAYTETGTAYQNEANVLVINKAGIVSYNDYSPLNVGSFSEIKHGDMFFYTTLEVEGNTASGWWNFDYAGGFDDGDASATIWYIPCPGKYICSDYESISDDQALVTSYFFVTKEDFADYPLYKDKANDLPSGIYAVTSTNFLFATSTSE